MLPTTAPAMAPAWLEDPAPAAAAADADADAVEEDSVWDVVVAGTAVVCAFPEPADVAWLDEDVGFTVGEAEAGAEDSGVAPMPCAWVGLKLPLVATSIKAHLGTKVPVGIEKGKTPGEMALQLLVQVAQLVKPAP